MSVVSHLLEQIQKTGIVIARVHQEIAGDPNSLSLQATLVSLEKRHRKLEKELLSELNHQHIEVFDYRIIFERDRPSFADIAKGFLDLQVAISTTYAAKKSGIPKLTKHIGVDVRRATSLDFGYAYPGSLGIVFTIPNERLLIGESFLDEAIAELFALTRATSPDEVRSFARYLGRGPILAMHDWSKVAAESGFGVSIHWRRGSDVRSQVLAQRAELERLYQVIEETSDEDVTSLTVEGNFDAVNRRSRTFTLVVKGGQIIAGRYESDDLISNVRPVQIPSQRYRLHITKRERIRYSTDDEDITYHLDDLEEI